MIEETEESVQIHVGCTLEEILLQRVLEVVDCFGGGGILKQFVVQVSLEERSFFGCFGCGECRPIIYGFSKCLSQLTFPSHNGGCLAVVDKMRVSSAQPVGRPALE